MLPAPDTVNYADTKGTAINDLFGILFAVVVVAVVAAVVVLLSLL